MKYTESIVSKLARLARSSFAALLLAAAACGVADAQDERPITRDNLLRSLASPEQERDLSAQEYVERIKQHGVDFRMTGEDEKKIRRAGAHLGVKGLDALVVAIRSSHRIDARWRVSVFEYAPCGDHGKDFVEMLSSKLTILTDKLISKDDRYRYTERLKVVKEGKSFDMSLAEAKRYWDQTYSLQLLRGMCRNDDAGVNVISLVFLGDLNGSLDSHVRIEFKLHPDEYGRTKDIHSVLILYSLAKDAQAKGVSKDLIIQYLAEASGIISDIKNSNPETLESVKGAIERMLNELGASNLMHLPARD
jgi:hypothetical protein